MSTSESVREEFLAVSVVVVRAESVRLVGGTVSGEVMGDTGSADSSATAGIDDGVSVFRGGGGGGKGGVAGLRGVVGVETLELGFESAFPPPIPPLSPSRGEGVVVPAGILVVG